MNTFLKLPIILLALLIFSSASYAASYKELGYASEAAMREDEVRIFNASNIFKGTILKLNCASGMAAVCSADIRVDEVYKNEKYIQEKILKYTNISKHFIDSFQLGVNTTSFFIANEVDNENNVNLKSENENAFVLFKKIQLPKGQEFLDSVISKEVYFRRYLSEIYYSSIIVLATTTWFECKALDKENHSCDFKFKVEKVLKGEKSLVGKELRSRESENFKDKLKVGEKSVFLLEEIDSNNNAKHMTVGDLVYNSREYLVEKLEALELLINKQKDPKYRPPMNTKSYFDISAGVQRYLYTSSRIFVGEVIKLERISGPPWTFGVVMKRLWSIVSNLGNTTPLYWWKTQIKIKNVLRGDLSPNEIFEISSIDYGAEVPECDPFALGQIYTFAISDSSDVSNVSKNHVYYNQCGDGPVFFESNKAQKVESLLKLMKRSIYILPTKTEEDEEDRILRARE